MTVNDFKDLVLSGCGLTAILFSIIEITPIKINPWSWIAKQVSKAFLGEILEKLQAIDSKLDAHITLDDIRDAATLRRYILRFNAELIRNIDHTQEEFNEVIEAMASYDAFCKAHPTYQNDRMPFAVANIKRAYAQLMQRHEFSPK